MQRRLALAAGAEHISVLYNRDSMAETLAWLATEPEGGRDSGRYFYRKAEETPAGAAQDDAAAARLWLESEALLAKLGF